MQIYRISVIYKDFNTENMDLSKKILDKGEINSRFVMAVYAILKNKLVNSKADLAESLDIKDRKSIV